MRHSSRKLLLFPQIVYSFSSRPLNCKWLDLLSASIMRQLMADKYIKCVNSHALTTENLSRLKYIKHLGGICSYCKVTPDVSAKMKTVI